MIVAPSAGRRSDRIVSRPLMVAGLALQSIALFWLAAISSPDTAYASLIAPFIIAGTGMALVFAPSANAILGAVRPEEAGQASGATNAIRELGGVMGVAVLPIGAGVLAAGAVMAMFVPGRRPRAAVDAGSAPAAAVAGPAGAAAA